MRDPHKNIIDPAEPRSTVRTPANESEIDPFACDPTEEWVSLTSFLELEDVEDPGAKAALFAGDWDLSFIDRESER